MVSTSLIKLTNRISNNLSNVEKSYNNNVALKNITLSFEENKLYVLIGSNGSGKSTLIKIISNVIFKTSGVIEKTSTISYLPDKYLLPKILRTDEFIKDTLSLYNLKMNPDLILDRFQIPKRLIGGLSKGNYQKLGLFIAFYNNADIYILDEPIDGLDDFAKKLFKELVKEKLELGKTLIISLHDKAFLNDLDPIIYEIKDGVISERKRRKKKQS